MNDNHSSRETYLPMYVDEVFHYLFVLSSIKCCLEDPSRHEGENEVTELNLCWLRLTSHLRLLFGDAASHVWESTCRTLRLHIHGNLLFGRVLVMQDRGSQSDRR